MRASSSATNSARCCKAATDPANARVALVSGWYSGRLLERDADAEWSAMRAHFDLLHALDCKVMVFAEVSRCTHGDQLAPISQRPHLPKGEWSRFGQRMTALAERMQREGLRMAYHHHMGTVVEAAEDSDARMANTGDAVGLLLDTGHLTYAGDDPAQVAARYARRIVHVHCRTFGARCSHLVAIAIRAFSMRCWKAFSQCRATVWSTIAACSSRSRAAGTRLAGGRAEQDPAVAPPLKYAKMGYQTCRPWQLDCSGTDLKIFDRMNRADRM